MAAMSLAGLLLRAGLLAGAVVLVTSSCRAEETTSIANHEREIVVTDQGGDQPLVLLLGQALVLRLAATPGTGYGWEVVEIDPPLLRRAPGARGEPEYVCPDPPRPGGSCTQILRFVGERPGAATLQLAYRRPWEKDQPPARTFRLALRIQSPVGAPAP